MKPLSGGRAQIRIPPYPPMYEAHPYAMLIPEMTDEEFQALKADIDKNELLEPVMLFRKSSGDPLILDGRHRERACAELGLRVRYDYFDGTEAEALRYVLAKNLARRHLTESQRAMIAAELTTFTHGGDRKSDQAANLPVDAVSQSQAAELLNVSERSVRDAKAIKAKSPEMAEKVRAGEIKVSAAAKKVRDLNPPERKREKRKPPVTIVGKATRIDEPYEKPYLSAEVRTNEQVEDARLRKAEFCINEIQGIVDRSKGS